MVPGGAVVVAGTVVDVLVEVVEVVDVLVEVTVATGPETTTASAGSTEAVAAPASRNDRDEPASKRSTRSTTTGPVACTTTTTPPAPSSSRSARSSRFTPTRPEAGTSTSPRPARAAATAGSGLVMAARTASPPRLARTSPLPVAPRSPRVPIQWLAATGLPRAAVRLGEGSSPRNQRSATTPAPFWLRTVMRVAPAGGHAAVGVHLDLGEVQRRHRHLERLDGDGLGGVRRRVQGHLDVDLGGLVGGVVDGDDLGHAVGDGAVGEGPHERRGRRRRGEVEARRAVAAVEALEAVDHEPAGPGRDRGRGVGVAGHHGADVDGDHAAATGR